jgi:hypothetical protein
VEEHEVIIAPRLSDAQSPRDLAGAFLSIPYFLLPP